MGNVKDIPLSLCLLLKRHIFPGMNAHRSTADVYPAIKPQSRRLCPKVICTAPKAAKIPSREAGFGALTYGKNATNPQRQQQQRAQRGAHSMHTTMAIGRQMNKVKLWQKVRTCLCRPSGSQMPLFRVVLCLLYGGDTFVHV